MIFFKALTLVFWGAVCAALLLDLPAPADKGLVLVGGAVLAAHLLEMVIFSFVVKKQGRALQSGDLLQVLLFGAFFMVPYMKELQASDS